MDTNHSSYFQDFFQHHHRVTRNQQYSDRYSDPPSLTSLIEETAILIVHYYL